MITIGEWLFEPRSRRLIAGQEERRLAPKAGALLEVLAESAGHLWSRDELLERVWPGVTVGEEVLTHAIAELRRVLGDDFRDPHYIETVHKSGYRLKLAARHRPVTGAADRQSEADGGLSHYLIYLEACDLFERGGSRNMQDAAARFVAVLDAEPDFLLARVGLAKALAFVGVYYCSERADLETVRLHCAEARRAASCLPEALAVEGLVWAIGRRFDRALQNFRTAVRLKPDSSEIHYLIGRACFAELDIAVAAPMFEQAAALKCEDYHSQMLAGIARQMIGDDRRAKVNFAIAEARIRPRLTACPEDLRAWCSLIRCLAQLGRWAEACTLLDRVSDHSDPMNFHLACSFARVGESERALDILEQVVEQGWHHGAWLARDPDFEALRGNRRYKRIAARIGAC
ncbi:MAG: winged helix-turn-helix domain-containing protein [Allosphingosinicella sp.]